MWCAIGIPRVARQIYDSPPTWFCMIHPQSYYDDVTVSACSVYEPEWQDSYKFGVHGSTNILIRHDYLLYFMLIDQNISQKFRPQLSRGHYVIYMVLDTQSFIKSENLAVEDWIRDCEWAKCTLSYICLATRGIPIVHHILWMLAQFPIIQHSHSTCACYVLQNWWIHRKNFNLVQQWCLNLDI